MGLFNKLFTSDTNSASEVKKWDYIPGSEQEAFVAIMYACLAIDDKTSEPERDMLTRSVVFKEPFFGKYNFVEELYKPALQAYAQFGSKTVIDFCASKILEENKPTLLCMVLDIALSDGVLAENEKGIIEYLISKLEMSEELATRVIEVMMYKNKWNVIIDD